jgi:hypothetical protein
MSSFAFWLTTACAIGAILATSLRAGIPEIIILWLLANGLSYGLRSVRPSRLTRAAS